MREVEVPLALEQDIILCIFYHLPGKNRKRLMRISTKVFSSLRLYVSGENLFTFTKFKYMDPEVPNGNALNMGIENLGYPNPRTFTVGVNVQF